MSSGCRNGRTSHTTSGGANGEAQVQAHDVARRLRRRPDQSLENPLGRGGGDLHEWVSRPGASGGCTAMEGGDTGLDDEIAACGTRTSAPHHGAQHVRPGARALGRRCVARLVGRRPAVPRAGVRPDPPPARAAGDAAAARPSTSSPTAPRRRSSVPSTPPAAGTCRSAVVPRRRSSTSARGLVDEMEIHVVPLLLGGGYRLFENLDGGPVGFECVGLVSSPAVAHYTYESARARRSEAARHTPSWAGRRW